MSSICLFWDSTDRFLVSACEYGHISIWDTKNNGRYCQVTAHYGYITKISLNAEDTFLCSVAINSGAPEYSIRIWNFPSLTPQFEIIMDCWVSDFSSCV